MIYLASDHGGFSIKEKVKQILDRQKLDFKDLGPHVLSVGDDYPDYVIPLALTVAKNKARGIIACRNGQGAAIAANKVRGIRAAVCWNKDCAASARNDDDSNILSLPADYLTDIELDRILSAWLSTPFSHDARHIRRIHKVADYETEAK